MKLFKNKSKKNWSDITLGQIQEIDSLPKYDDEIDLIINYLSVIWNKDASYIENLPVTTIINGFEEWAFINDKPTSASTPIIKLKGKKYGAIELSTMTLAQMVDIEEYISEGLMLNLHKIFSVIYLPIKSFNPITKKYTTVEYQPSVERQDVFLGGTMDILYPQMLFFWSIVKIYLEDLQSSSKMKMRTIHTEMVKEMITKESPTQTEQLKQ